MQGLLSYSDDEEDDLRQPTASSSSSHLAIPQPADRSTTKPRPTPPPPSHRPPATAGPPRLSSKPTLPPNLVRKTPNIPSSSNLASTSTSAFPSSPLRRPYARDAADTESPPPPVPFPRERHTDPNGLSEEDQLTNLLRPPRLANGDGWEEEYGLRRMVEGREAEVDEALQTKTDFFLSLKRKGTHFNDSLMQNKAFRNPTIYKKLVDHVGVDERAGRYASVWEWGREKGDEECDVERIADLQKARSALSNHTPGSRSSIAFSSSQSTSSHPNASSSQISFPPNPLLPSSRPHHSSKDKQAALRDTLSSRTSGSSSRGVVSGGKEYGFVGLIGSEDVKSGSHGGEKRHRDKGDREGKSGKVSRWG